MLAELRRRGEASPDDVDVVVAMLADESEVRRQRGFLALRGAFPDLLKAVPDYRTTASPEARADAVAVIRKAIRDRVGA